MYFYKKVGDIGPFEICKTDYHGDNVGLRDRSGRWVITPEMGFQSFSDYDDGLMVAYRRTDNGGGFILVDYHGNCISDVYGYIKPANEGYYIVDKGARQNIMRRDGSLVLKDWPHHAGKVRDGYFHISNTIRKTKTTPTRYIYGIAHVSGIVVFPMIFESVDFYDDPNDSSSYVKQNGEPYCVYDGAIYDPQKRHYPSTEKKLDIDKYINQIINWILPGLQFFYRDTDADIDVEKMYPIGKVLRTGFNTSVSAKLQQPAQKTRFFIAAAHAAKLYSEEDGEVNEDGLYLSPRAEEWQHAVLSKNSWLKVLDVYKVGDVTQVFMIQIPETAAQIFEDNEVLFNFIDDYETEGYTLVEYARKSLNEKMRQLVHPRSTDRDFISLMWRPVGYTLAGPPYSIEPDYSLEEQPLGRWSNTPENNRHLNTRIHWLAGDRDIVHYYDEFPWRGIVGTVCDGCMYAKGTKGVPNGCGRLFQKTFRKNYIRGVCEFWKFSIKEESDFERDTRCKKEREKEFKAKTSGAYAYSLLYDFIDEHLHGDINNLLKFDFNTLFNSEKYGPIKGPTVIPNFAIMRSIIEVAFGDYWPDLNVETLDNYQYQIGTIINFHRLAGARVAHRRFMLLERVLPDPRLVDLAENLHAQCNTIGDFIVWPNKVTMANMFDDHKMRGYIDRLFIDIYDVMTDAKKQNMDVKAALYKNRKMMKNYQGKDGFIAFMKNALLDDFINEDGSPKHLFDGVSINAKDFKLDLLPGALRQYHDFMVPTIERRSQRIVELLKERLNLH